MQKRIINTDFIEYGGVEQGPNAEIRSGESKFPDYWISSILNIFYLRGHLQVAPEGVKLGPRRSQEVRRSLGPQNGGLRALEEAWDELST